ncbi:MAG: hypothetical protein QF513_02540, partial [Gammaproteobacteria bacterium]|nr:hypothetical protein [Gammaproteobacteria bacterium]
MKSNSLRFIILLFISCNALAVNDDSILSDDPPNRLSEFNFFSDPMNHLPNKNVVPYDLITPLFTDYADKH